jgi:16S rRNA (guanine527-N7)-methyltransferase
MTGIAAVAQEVGLIMPAATAERLDAYVALLMEANSQFNLTAIKDPSEIERNLVGGSLELSRHLPHGARTLIDVGTGGGVPGLVVAIFRPELQVTLLDSTGKKVRFLEETSKVLGLTNVTPVHGRAEDLARDAAFRESFDCGTARAVARLATLVELVLPFVRPGGFAVFPKGESAQAETDEASQAIGFVGGKNPRLVPSSLDDTRYVIIDKNVKTPDRFPRRVGIPGKRPIGVPEAQASR